MTDPYFGTICLCAVRYAIGRQTYMPSIVQNFIRNHINDIDQRSIDLMIKEINEKDEVFERTMSNGSVLKIDNLGDTEVDRPGWESLREFLKEQFAR